MFGVEEAEWPVGISVAMWCLVTELIRHDLWGYDIYARSTIPFVLDPHLVLVAHRSRTDGALNYESALTDLGCKARIMQPHQGGLSIERQRSNARQTTDQLVPRRSCESGSDAA